jgi:hypothetical protein
MANLIAFRETHNVPVWVGETGENNNAWLSQNIAKLENAGIGWCHWTYKRHDWQQNAALARLGGNYPTDGAGAMATVLDSILYSNIIPNTNTIAAVTATLPPAGSTGCRAVSNLCAPVGSFVSIRGNNRLFVTTAQGQSGLTCTASAPGSAERFEVVDAGNGRVALRSANGNYVSSGNAQGDMTSDSPSIGALEQFEWLDLGNGTFALRGSNGLFVSSENGTRPMRCDRPVAQEWEGFTYELIESCVGDIADDIGTFGIDGQVNFGDFLSLLGRIGQCP